MRNTIKVILALTILAAATMACTVPFQSRLIQGSGNVIVEQRSVRDFDKIHFSGAGRVILTQGDAESLSIETDDNLMEYIRTEVRGDTLEIEFTDGALLIPGAVNLDPSAGLIFRISVIDLNTISVSGAADINMKKLKADNFMINFSGAGDISIDDLNADHLEVVVSGAGDINLAGKVGTQDIRLSGLGRYESSDLESKSASVTISGAGGAEVWAIENLNVTISGAGDVKYYGDPTVNPEISGLGRIQGLGEK